MAKHHPKVVKKRQDLKRVFFSSGESFSITGVFRKQVSSIRGTGIAQNKPNNDASTIVGVGLNWSKKVPFFFAQLAGLGSI
mmetsp:Transcript_45620/g.82501  ORF Transcript_45620/g.82501 Transcript_45620/m.82501 type:complete len:81 (-) Transcript_45620:325-567(-)